MRVHAGTRILIRSLGQSCCAEPVGPIAVDEALGKKEKISKTTARGGGVRRRDVGSPSSYSILEEQVQLRMELQNRQPGNSSRTGSLNRAEGCGFPDRITGTILYRDGDSWTGLFVV